jgi:hypothetical protein
VKLTLWPPATVPRVTLASWAAPEVVGDSDWSLVSQNVT